MITFNTTTIFMIRAVIIEDEPIFQDLLKKAIRNTGLDIHIEGVCCSKRAAKKLIEEVVPQLLFLDVELTDGKGVDLLRELKYQDFEVIFTTSHDKYAISAIKNNAADYLLKPIKENELMNAVEKVSKRIQERQQLKAAADINDNIHAMKNNHLQDAKLMVPTKDGVIFLKITDIIRLQSSSNYTEFHLSGHKKVLVSKTLKNFEERLLTFGFFRVHQSHLINLHHIQKVDLSDNVVLMSDGCKVEIAKRKKKDFLETIRPEASNYAGSV
jgi:two-component system LytT family response regulator